MNVSSATTPGVNATPRVQSMQANEPRQDTRTQQERQNNPTQSTNSQAPVINAQGQTTGRLVNLTA